MQWQIISRLQYSPTGLPLTWELTQPPRYVCVDGYDWTWPRGARFNGCSSPRPVWWYRPPLDGTWFDYDWFHHDMLSRCWRLLELRPSYVQDVFRRGLIAHGMRPYRARMKQIFTWPFVAFMSPGDGLTGDERYDQSVWGGLSLPEWVRENYPAGPVPYDPTA